MPIKVRCKHCETVLIVSDEARGRAVKCRECGGRVPIGTGQRKSRPQKRKSQRSSVSPDNLFGGLDLNAAEDRQQKICPSCTRLVSGEDTVCSNCGVDIETGVLSERERLRRLRNAPPTEEFYGDVWGNAWKFTWENQNWILITALIWATTATLALCSLFTLRWYVDGRAEELRESGSPTTVDITEERVLIDLNLSPDPEKGFAIYDGTRYTRSSVRSDGTLTLPGPVLGALLSPPSVFWCLIFLVSVLGFGGWAWTLAVKIVDTTMRRGDKIKRLHTDLFASMAMGFRSIFWPIVLFWPFVGVPFLIQYLTGNLAAVAITGACIYLIPLLLFLPTAIVHMTQTYTYRAWLLNWVSVGFIKTILPSLYVSVLMFVFVMITPLTCCILMVVLQNTVVDLYTYRVEVPILFSLIQYDPEDGLGFSTFAFFRLPLLAGIAFTSSIIVFGILAYPSVFMMRIYGVFGYYFRPDLSLINEQVELEPAGLGPRFLSFLIDTVLLAVMAGVSLVVSPLIIKLFGFAYNFSEFQVLLGSWLVVGISTTILWTIYFSTWEAGQNRGTLGKIAIGLVVLTNDDKPVKFREAFIRTICGVLTVLTLFGGFVMCAFHPGRRSLHDMISKTKVVWRGEGEEA
ncbi:MAG: RDD family protein [Fuerstiella sp.]|nr:RDD family protein [Fuerstiella sp.]